MAGLGLALIGGALKGFGEGQLASIKATREEKLRQLELDRAERMETSRQTFAAREGELGRASQERQSAAQIAATERNTQAQLGTQKELTKLEIGSREKLSGDQLTQRRDEVAAQIASGEKIAGSEIDSRKDIAQMQIDAASALDTKFVTQSNGTTVMMQGGKVVPMPIDPATNKPMSPAITDNDTPEAKNVKYLMTLGVDKDKALALVYNAKNANRDLAEAGIFKSIVDGMSTMSDITEKKLDFAKQKAREVADGIYGAEPAPGAPAPVEPTTAAPGASADIVIPKEWTDEQVRAAVAEAISGGAKKEDLSAAVRRNGRDPAKVGL